MERGEGRRQLVGVLPFKANEQEVYVAVVVVVSRADGTCGSCSSARRHQITGAGGTCILGSGPMMGVRAG